MRWIATRSDGEMSERDEDYARVECRAALCTVAVQLDCRLGSGLGLAGPLRSNKNISRG